MSWLTVLVIAMPNLRTLDGQASEPQFSETIHRMAKAQCNMCPGLSSIVLGVIPDEEMIKEVLHSGSTFGPDLHEIL
jgi:hypothetical protein